MNNLRKQAIYLREKGYSYTMISEKLGVPKSTLSNWLGEILFIPNKEVIQRVSKAKLKSALYKHNLKFQNIAEMKLEAKKEIGKLSKRDLFLLGIGLYLGEGSKSYEEIRIANADPAIIKITIKWLKTFTSIKHHHLRISIHGYPDHNINDLINFWSKELSIHPDQFTKTIIDNRPNKSGLKKRKLPYGTVQLYVRGGGTLVPGVKNLHRKIMGWIETTTKQI